MQIGSLPQEQPGIRCAMKVRTCDRMGSRTASRRCCCCGDALLPRVSPGAPGAGIDRQHIRSENLFLRPTSV